MSAALSGGGFVILDTALDADLIAEGYARDSIRVVQDARKDADLDIADRITPRLVVPVADVSKTQQFRALTTHENLPTCLHVLALGPAQALGPEGEKACADTPPVGANSVA